MRYTLKGEKKNKEKFLSKIPIRLNDCWTLKPNVSSKQIVYNYCYEKEIEKPFCVQITYQNSYEDYDIKVSPSDSAKKTSYDEEFCPELLAIFIADFSSWAYVCDIEIAKESRDDNAD